jgi:hypothetical protein
MNIVTRRTAVVAAAVGLLSGAISPSALADVRDYEFQLVRNEAKKGNGTIVSVRLVNKRTGQPVPDAVISAKRVDMAPDGMADMAGKIEQLPSTEPGTYRFKTNLSMEGRCNCRWRRKCRARLGRSRASSFSRSCREAACLVGAGPRRNVCGGDRRISPRSARPGFAFNLGQRRRQRR